MKKLEKKNVLLTSCIIILLVVCYFGINAFARGTRATPFSPCGDKHSISYNGQFFCCPNVNDSIVILDGTTYCLDADSKLDATESGTRVCLRTQVLDAGNGNSCKFDGETWEPINSLVNDSGKVVWTCSNKLSACTTVAVGPSSSSSSSSKPSSSSSSSSKPSSSSSSSSKPSSSSSSSSKPSSSSSSSSKPSSSSPITSKPTTSKPTSSEPTTPKPSSSEPTTPKPSSSEPTTPKPTVSEPTSSSSNIFENPQTGQIAIFVVWVIALAAMVYSVWYFKKVKED